jgi:L-malate glycosyltransferase
MSTASVTPDLMVCPQKVAVVAPSLDILGGQGVQARALMQALEGVGYQVLFVPINPRFPAGLGWLRKIPYLRTLANQIFYRWQLRKIRHVDIVHLFSASYWSFVLSQVPAIKAAKRYAKPVVLNYHSGEAEDHLRHWGSRVHPWLSAVKSIVVPSVYLKQVFGRFGYKTVVIPNMVSLGQFNYRIRTALRPRLLSVRNLEPIYRIENTLAAFALIKKKRPDATLTIVGYGSLEASLKALVNTLELTDVQFLGRVEPLDMADVYDQADIFVNSSVVDNQPVSILEAFASGLPVVSTATGDIAYMIKNEETGLLVPADRPDAIAEAVFCLLNNPSEALLIANAARLEVERYTWDKVGVAWKQLFDGVAT